jgi:hypothetical protein
MNIREILTAHTFYNGVQQTKETYYDVGNTNEFVVSHSLIKNYSSEDGGSYEKMLEYLSSEKIGKSESKSLENGTLIHRYMENPTSFEVDDDDKPSDTICAIVDKLFNEYELDLSMPLDHQLLMAPIIEIAKEIGYYPKWGDEAKHRNIVKDGKVYFEFLKKANGKTILTKAQKIALEGMKSSLNGDQCAPFVHGGFMPMEFKELPLFVQVDGIWYKILVDYLGIDIENKIVAVSDLKSTSKPLPWFIKHMEPGLDNYGDLVYQYRPGPFYYHRYYRQLGFYVGIIKEILTQSGVDLGAWRFDAYILAVESTDYFKSDVIEVKWSDIRFGQNEAQILTNRLIAEAAEKGLINREF